MIKQINIKLPVFSRGFHLITDIIEDQIGKLPENGLVNLFLKHTSAGLCINENYDPSVRVDLNNIFDQLVPENQSFYTHTLEGSDDMPAHVKSILSSVSLTIPIENSKLALGTWQGIYLCEFRNNPGQRNILITIYK